MNLVEERFWSKVNKEGPIHPYDPSLGECWEWIAFRRSEGYGRFSFNRKTEQAHRVSLKLIGVIIPPKILVCHSCDNPPCVNPKHLFLGSDKDNSNDKVLKNRQGGAKGETNQGAKIT